MSDQSIASSLYTGASGLGKLSALLGAIIGTIAGVGLIIYGIHLMTEENTRAAGIYSLLGGIAFILVGWIVYWLTRKSKAFAAIEGASVFFHR